jgi:hypothetical protein
MAEKTEQKTDPKSDPKPPAGIWRASPQEFTEEDFKSTAAAAGVPVEGTKFELEDEERGGVPGRKIVIVD